MISEVLLFYQYKQAVFNVPKDVISQWFEVHASNNQPNTVNKAPNMPFPGKWDEVDSARNIFTLNLLG